MLNIPDPVVFKHGSPVKALLLEGKNVITGNDQGEIKVIDKETFHEVSTIRCDEAPVLKVEKQMYALLA